MVSGMVTRPRLRSILTALTLYAIAAALDRLFRGERLHRQPRLRARQDLDARLDELAELNADRLRRQSASNGSTRSALKAPRDSIPTCWTSAPG